MCLHEGLYVKVWTDGDEGFDVAVARVFEHRIEDHTHKQRRNLLGQ